MRHSLLRLCRDRSGTLESSMWLSHTPGANGIEQKKRAVPLQAGSFRVQHEEFEISEHLAQALRRLRKERGYAYVWVDAVCINQQDYDEKAQQVPLMFQIFDKATQVFIWLGEPPAMPTTQRRRWICRQVRPWWTRLWVVQECIYSIQCPIVLLGPDKFQLDLFVVWLLTPEERFQTFDPVEVARSLQGLYEAWLEHSRTGSTREPLLRRILQTKDLECEDFRDRVYALLSLLPEKDIAHFVIDYQKTDRNLAIEICGALFTASGWTYGDLQHTCDFIMRLHAQSSAVYPSGLLFSHASEEHSPDGMLAPGFGYRKPINPRVEAYNELTGVVLKNMCIEQPVRSQLVRGSKFRKLGDCEWLYKLFVECWTTQIRNFDTRDKFSKLCRLYSRTPSDFWDEHGVFEWTALSGICGFYFSPRQIMNAKVLFSMKGKHRTSDRPRERNISLLRLLEFHEGDLNYAKQHRAQLFQLFKVALPVE